MTSRLPDVSVLMGVFNAGPTLERTLDSILSQEGVELEFIVVDDGSTDGSGDILDRRAAQDGRLVVLHQPNAGLTAALQRGSELVRGRYIARQDAGGDRSLPGRLTAQMRALEAHEGAVFVTCGHRYMTRDDVFLCDEVRGAEEIAAGLSTLRFPGVRGIMHANAMFETTAFRSVGGYRREFAVAQDIDLWLRLHEKGACAASPEILYECRFEPGGISSRRYAKQMAFAELAVRCAIARRQGQPEPPLTLDGNVGEATDRSPAQQAAEYHHFVASCLRGRDPRGARRHYLEAWRAQPTRLKSLLGAMATWARRP